MGAAQKKECPSGSKRRLQSRFQKPSEQWWRLWNKHVSPRGPLEVVGVPRVVCSGPRALSCAGETLSQDGTPRPRQLPLSGETCLPKIPLLGPPVTIRSSRLQATVFFPVAALRADSGHACLSSRPFPERLSSGFVTSPPHPGPSPPPTGSTWG